MKLTELGQAGFHGRILRESTVGCCEIPWSDAMRISGRMACETLVGWRAKPWSDVVRICICARQVFPLQKALSMIDTAYRSCTIPSKCFTKALPRLYQSINDAITELYHFSIFAPRW